MKIESPCLKICELDLSHFHCRGCGRSREEIARWMSYTPGQRREIMAGLPARLESLQPSLRNRPLED